MKHTTVRRISAALTSLLLLTFVLVLPVSADMGPKPQITITVINPPEGEYYLDLLEQHDPGDTLYSNLNDEELTALPEQMPGGTLGKPDGLEKPRSRVFDMSMSTDIIQFAKQELIP